MSEVILLNIVIIVSLILVIKVVSILVVDILVRLLINILILIMLACWYDSLTRSSNNFGLSSIDSSSYLSLLVDELASSNLGLVDKISSNRKLGEPHVFHSSVSEMVMDD